jgi:K+-sensing histidine kinase KdpD
MGRPYQDADASSYPLVAVCIDKQDKNSQNALKWAMDSLVQKGQTVGLVHVNTKGTSGGVDDGAGFKQPTDPQMKDLFRPFRCFCTRKDIQCKDVVLDESDVAKAIIEFAANGAIEKLVIGATARGGFRFKADIPTTISKGAPDFCTVYIVNKGKVSSTRNAIRAAPRVSPLRSQIQQQQQQQSQSQVTTPLAGGPKAEPPSQ